MSERLSRKTPEQLPNVERVRSISGFEMGNMSKTGSRLETLTAESSETVLRHSELPPSAMAAWQFLHTYADKAIDPMLAERLYGPWGRPQVAPILQKEGHDRVYYGSEKAVSYSSIAGFDTALLSEELHLTHVLPKYSHQRVGTEEGRWGGSAMYHLLTDVITAHPDLDSEGQIRKLLEVVWDGFDKENRSFISRKDFISIRELRTQDTDNDDDYQASLELIERSHELNAEIVRAYHRAQSKGTEWQGQGTDKSLLLALHLSQTMTQHFIMWYLGFSHGHLHMRNSVSAINEPNSLEGKISPLSTFIIDFDRASPQGEKLGDNDELFSHVRTEELRQHILNPRMPAPLRGQFLCYLPPSQWDSSIIEFARTNGTRGRSAACRMVACRAHKDISSPEQYNTLVRLIYDVDQANKDGFESTLLMIKNKPEFISPDDAVAGPLARYLMDGTLPSADTPLTPEAIQLVLAAMQSHYSENERHPLFRPQELLFLIRVAGGDTENRSLAALVLYRVRMHSSVRLSKLILEALDSEAEITPELVGGALQAIEFSSYDSAFSKDLYYKLQEKIIGFTNGASRQKFLEELKRKAKKEAGPFFALARSLKF